MEIRVSLYSRNAEAILVLPAALRSVLIGCNKALTYPSAAVRTVSQQQRSFDSSSSDGLKS